MNPLTKTNIKNFNFNRGGRGGGEREDKDVK